MTCSINVVTSNVPDDVTSHMISIGGEKPFSCILYMFFFKRNGDTNSSKTIKELNSLEYKISKLTVSFK